MSATIHVLPATLMRGGTSKGLFFRADSLPAEPALREALLRRAIGSPDPCGSQIDGLGTGISSTSKVVLLSRSERPGHDVDYLFGHVAIRDGLIDWSGNCGNLTAAVPWFALMEGLLTRDNGPAEVRIWQANTGKTILADVEVRDGRPQWAGDCAIDGVAFPAAPVRLRFLDPAGGCAGRLFPTGRPIDTLQLPDGRSVEATLIDAGNPLVLVDAAALGLSGDETADRIDDATFDTLERLRATASVMMGLAGTIEQASLLRPATPKIAFLSRARRPDCQLNARILSMGRLHHAFTGTGAIGLAASAALPDTLASRLLDAPASPLCFSHAAGTQTLGATVSRGENGWHIDEVAMIRTARPLMRGELFIPLDD